MRNDIAIAVAASALLAGALAGAQDKPKPAPDLAMLPYADTSRSVTLADGRRIHLVCMGTGSPTVILTSGLGEWGATWDNVQPAIAKKTRACAWDRAGFGLSDASTVPQTVDNTTTDLEAALRRGGIKGPYVVVGHSLGGYESLLFADRHPKQTVGMVLVDPSVPGQFDIFATLPAFYAFVQKAQARQVAEVRKCATAVRSGALKIGDPDPDGCLAYPATYPASVSDAVVQRDAADPTRFDTQASLMANFPADSRIVVNPKRNMVPCRSSC